MIKLRYLFENFELAYAALKNWDYDKKKTENAIQHFRISSNAVSPFYQGEQLCFLRLAPVEEKFECNVRGELEFISWLRTKNYPAMKPINSKSGENLLVLDTEWGKYYAAAFECVSGIPIEETDYSEKIMYEYGKKLGMLHNLSAEFVPTVKKWSYKDALDWTGEVIHEYGGSEKSFAELEQVKCELEKLSKSSDSFGLVHYDFEPDNVFYSEKDGCSVIDFDDGMYHWYSLDIAQVFEALADEIEGEKLENAKRDFIFGYTSEHALTAEMKAQFPIMNRFINLFGYARIIRCLSDRFEEEPEWLSELRIHLGKVVELKESKFMPRES